MKNRLELKIYGRVQGVTFRFSARRLAGRLGLTGWIKNINDGTVEAVVEGEEKDLREFLKWCARGPLFAKVADVKVEKLMATGEFDNFEILY